MKGTATAIQTNYAAFVNEIREKQSGKALEETMMSGWAAHFLPLDLFEFYYSYAMVDQNAFTIIANADAKKAASKVRTFAQRPKTPKPAPKLEDAEEKALRQEWQESPPIFRAYAETPESATAKIAEMSADDLHEITMNLTDETDAPTALAIARHPRLDRGTALELLYRFSASSYQVYWRRGREEDSFDELDQMFFEMFETLARRLNTGELSSSRFENRLHAALARSEDWGKGSDDPYHPTNWVKWRLTPAALAKIRARPHHPRIHCDHSVVLPRFEDWKAARTR